MKKTLMTSRASLRYILVSVLLLGLFSGTAGARSYEYHADSLDISFNAIRRPDIDNFIGVLVHAEGNGSSGKKILLSWEDSIRRARFIVIDGVLVQTYDVDSLSWPAGPGFIPVSIRLDFINDRAVLLLAEREVIIDGMGLSLNKGYNVRILPELSRKKDPNVPAIVECSDMHINKYEKPQNKKVWFWLIGIILVDLAFSLAVLYLQHKRKKQVGKSEVASQSSEETHLIPEQPTKGAILLFGGFHAYSSDGEDITRLFSPMLRELFLLIVMNSMDNGITSMELKEALWPDKDLRSARNNRSVYINKLRVVLDKIGNYTLGFDSGYWTFRTDDIYVDFLEFKSLENVTFSRSEALRVMSITQRGSLLPDSDYGWLDQFKAETADMVICKFSRLADEPECEKMPDFAIAVAETIEHFDDMSEKALHLKCRAYMLSGRHASAKGAYDMFVSRYREIYCDDFKHEFSYLINTPVNSI